MPQSGLSSQSFGGPRQEHHKFKTSLGVQSEFKTNVSNLVKPLSKCKKEGKGGLRVERT